MVSGGSSDSVNDMCESSDRLSERAVGIILRKCLRDPRSMSDARLLQMIADLQNLGAGSTIDSQAAMEKLESLIAFHYQLSRFKTNELSDHLQRSLDFPAYRGRFAR